MDGGAFTEDLIYLKKKLAAKEFNEPNLGHVKFDMELGRYGWNWLVGN